MTCVIYILVLIPEELSLANCCLVLLLCIAFYMCAVGFPNIKYIN